MNALPDIPLGLYECPHPYKRLMSPQLLRWCGKTGRFLFLKDTSCNSEEIGEKIKAVKGTGLKIFNANAATLLDTLRQGAAGFSGVMANIHPEFYVWICSKYQDNPKKAEQLMDCLGIISVIETQLYPNFAKAYLNSIGVTMNQYSRVHSGEHLSFSQKRLIEQLKHVDQMLEEWLSSK